MDTWTYEHICETVKTGKRPMVMNLDTKEKGEVYLCNHGFFNVHVGEGSEVWPHEKCKVLDS